MNPILIKILRKMCSLADVEFDSVDFDEESWYCKHSWSKEQEEEFTIWLTDFMKKKENRTVSGAGSLLSNNEARIKFAESFVMHYGWKTE